MSSNELTYKQQLTSRKVGEFVFAVGMWTIAFTFCAVITVVAVKIVLVVADLIL